MPPSSHRIAIQFGKAVRQLRTEAGMTQAQLAEAAGLKPNFLGEVERAEKSPSIETVIKIAEGLGLTGQRLLAKANL